MQTRESSEPLVLDMGQIVLRVRDLGQALTFYRDLLGFRVSDDSHAECCQRVKISTGGGEIVLFEQEDFTPLGLGPQGLETPLRLRVQDFAKAASFLELQGVRVTREDEHGGTVWDPSGNAIGLDDRPPGEEPRSHRGTGGSRRRR